MSADRTNWLELERAIGLGDPEHTRAEVSKLAGVDAETARRLWRALGFPDAADEDRIFTAADVEMLRAAAALVQSGVVTEAEAIQVTRVLGQSLARVADAEATSFEQALAAEPAALADAVKALGPMLESFLSYVWRRHFAAALHKRVNVGAEGGVDTCVGFADLVGFTAASQQLTYEEIAAMVGRFEALAHDTIAIHGGHVIKMIGDEVMFAIDRGASAGSAALEIAAACESDDLIPSARVGVARGGVLRHEADLFGPTVNLASRLVGVARPGTVLVSDELARSLAGETGFELRRLRPQKFRGMGEVRVHVLRSAR